MNTERRSTWFVRVTVPTIALVSASAVIGATAVTSQRGREAELGATGASGSLTLELNIPAFRLDVREDSTIIRSYQVAVGMTRYKTPTGEFEISRIVWNPWWYPPDAEWAAKDTVTPPGPQNPMGKVKLLFNGPYYLHGTPQIASLGHAASHGCVRMRSADAAELATIVQEHGGATVSREFMDSVTRSWSRTRMITLAVFIPVMIVYELVEVRDSTVTVYPDVYRRAGMAVSDLVRQALVEAGVDSAVVSSDAVRALARKARWNTVSAPIREVLVP